MRIQRKPGPKSRTKRTGFSGDLGEISTDSDESTPFMSPDRDSNATEYGLNYTNTSTRSSARLSELNGTNISPRHSARHSNVPHSTTDQPPPVPDNPNQQPEEAAPTNSSRGRRRKKTPRQREVLFWKNVRELQASTTFQIPRKPFGLLVREIIYNNSNQVNRITLGALEALQTAVETYVTQRLQDAYLLALHCKRVTLMSRDLQILALLKDA